MGLTEAPALSMVIPAYNEEARIARTLEEVLAYAGPSRPSEVLVVDDGSTDRTPQVVAAYASRAESVRLLRLPAHQGKGAAVRTGMLCATGELRCFTDADLSTPIEEMERMVALLWQGYEVVIGSRALTDSAIGIRQHPVREGMGKTFNRIVRAVFPLTFRDTQCGFKGFRHHAAREIFSRTRINGFAFDVEVLLLAQRLGFSIAELPVRWNNSPVSKVSLLGHPVSMGMELWSLHRHLRQDTRG